MQIIKKNFLIIFLFFYLIFGSLASIKSGISFDENHEEINWRDNVNISKKLSSHLLFGEEIDLKILERTVGYGIGFQLISQPIQFLLKDLIANNNISDFGGHLLAKHFVVFLFFFTSGIFFYLILKKIIENENFTKTGTIIYLLYPYLFGQSLFSPKDIPFMSIWLICTYFSLKLFERLIDKQGISNLNTIFFAFMTSYLLSIRIAGILIFIQYLATFIIYLSLTNINIFLFLKKFYSNLLIFVFATIFFTIVFYPELWINPLGVVDVINTMSNHFNNVGTNTYGKIMYSTNLPSTYMLIWFSVKLPIIIIIGICLIPFTEKKIFNSSKRSIYFGSLLISTILIPLILIFRKVHLYDELRQVMFLFPLIFIIGLVSVYTFSKKFFYIISMLTITLFLIENIKINPYQYVWFNLPSRSVDLTNKFELEYQGLSGREIAEFLNNSDKKDLCILANPMHSVKPFLNKNKFTCFDSWQKIDTDYRRPFLGVQNVRNIKKSKPYKCESIHETGFKLLFHKKKFITGRLLECT